MKKAKFIFSFLLLVLCNSAINAGVNPTLKSSDTRVSASNHFTLYVENNKPNTNIIWQKSIDDVNYTTMEESANNYFTIAQQSSTYYRSIVYNTQENHRDTSNSLRVMMVLPTGYCNVDSPCHGAAPGYITNVNLGTMNNTSSCQYVSGTPNTFYNTLTVPNLIKGSTMPMSLTFYGGSDFAIWVDLNADGVYGNDELIKNDVGETFVPDPYSIQISSCHFNITIPNQSDYVGETRMRIRAGYQVGGLATTADKACCDLNEDNGGETEDYLVFIENPNSNAAVTEITPPCNKNSTQPLEIKVQNRGTVAIASSDLTLNLTLSGGVNANYQINNTSIILPNDYYIFSIPNINFNTTTDININALALLANDIKAADNLLSQKVNLGIRPSISSNLSSTCAGISFVLKISKNLVNTSLQWQKSTTNANFADIAGAISNAMTTTQSSATYYRCVVSCGADTDTSNAILITMLSTAQCNYCTASTTGCATSTSGIHSVKIANLNNESSCGSYTLFNTLAVPKLAKGASYTMIVGANQSSVAAWIDYNKDGVFTENVLSYAPTTSCGFDAVFPTQITIPSTATTGLTRMRIRAANVAITSACGAGAAGEVEDYFVEIINRTVDASIVSMTPPCAKSSTATTSVTVKNNGQSTIAIGGLSLNIALSNGLSVSYNITNSTAILVGATAILSIPNMDFNSNQTIIVSATIQLANDVNLLDNETSTSVKFKPEIYSNLSSACSNASFELNILNPQSSTTYRQWQLSTDNITFTNISAATNAYLSTTQTALRYYRVITGCATSRDTSNVITITQNAPLDCYCTPYSSEGCTTSGANITNVQYGTINNSTGCAASPFYDTYNNVIPNIQQGVPYNFSLTLGNTTNQFFCVWIDYNGNKLFEESEGIFSNTVALGANATFTGTITLPLGTFTGLTKMRIISEKTYQVYKAYSCYRASVNGEIEDYTINIECNSNAPTLTTPTISTTNATIKVIGSVYFPYIIEYGAAGFTPGTGSTAGTGGIVVNATALNTIISGLLEGTSYDYYVRQACGGTYSSNSSKRTFTTNCSNIVPYNDGFNTVDFTACWTQSIVTAGATAPQLNIVTTSASPLVAPAEGARMLQFNSSSASANASILLKSKILNAFSLSSVDVSFQMFEEASTLSNVDKVTLQYSINSGTTWTTVADNVRPNPYQTQGKWFTRSFTLPIDAANKSSLRVGLLFTSAGGNNIYIDDFKVYATPAFTNLNNNICSTFSVSDVTGYNTFRIFNGAATLAEINPNGQNLGTLTLQILENQSIAANVPYSVINTAYHLPRYFNLSSSLGNSLSQNASVNLFLAQQELTDFNAKLNATETPSTLKIKTYQSTVTPSTQNCIISDNLTPSQILLVTGSSNRSDRFSLSANTNQLGEFGVFAAQDYPPIVKAKVFLAGLNVVTKLMTAYLPIEPNFPLTDPYAAVPFAATYLHVNSGATASTTTTVLQATGSNSIIDWVFVELRSGVSGATSVAYSRAALLQADGDVVDMDGVSPLKFPLSAIGNYYVALRHRTHLGARSSATVAISPSSPLVNFTNSITTFHGLNPLLNVAVGTYTLNGGDANVDGSIDSIDSAIWENDNGSFDDYQLLSDYNLDGSVDSIDSALWETNNGKYEELD